MVVALTKKQQWKENDEWVVVGLKESKSVERGWIVVPDKNKKPSRDRGVPERVDKVLARHGVCTRSEAKSFIRHGRVTFEGEVVTRPEQKVVVRLYDGVMVDGKPIPVMNVAEKENVDAEEEDPNASED